MGNFLAVFLLSVGIGGAVGAVATVATVQAVQSSNANSVPDDPTSVDYADE